MKYIFLVELSHFLLILNCSFNVCIITLMVRWSTRLDKITTSLLQDKITRTSLRKIFKRREEEDVSESNYSLLFLDAKSEDSWRKNVFPQQKYKQIKFNKIAFLKMIGCQIFKKYCFECKYVDIWLLSTNSYTDTCKYIHIRYVLCNVYTIYVYCRIFSPLPLALPPFLLSDSGRGYQSHEEVYKV